MDSQQPARESSLILADGETGPDLEQKAKTASFNLGSSYETLNPSLRGSINSSESELGVSPGRAMSPPSALKISLLGGKLMRSSKRRRNVSFAGAQGVPRTHLDLKEAGSVVRPGGTSEVESPLGSSTLHSENREDVYILYEEDEEEEEGGEEEGRGAVADERESSGLLNPSFLRPIPGRSNSTMSPSNSVYSVISTGGGIIDGRFSFSAGTPADGFVAVEAPADYGPASISIDLQVCKKTVLKPYLVFLKVIGWRKLRDDGGMGEIRCPRFIACLNFIYPAFIFTMLLLANISQILTCFYRDQPVFLDDITREPLLNRPINVSVTCEDNLVTKLIFPDILLLATYLCGLYIFRYGEPEHLAAIMETVFLSANAQHVKSRKRMLIFVLRSLLLLGGVWLFYDIVINIGRGFSLQVFYDAPIGYLSGTRIRYFFVAFSLFGFVIFDMVYLSVIITYASQSELIQFYITGIIDKVNTKSYTLEEAMKDIQRTYDYLRVMNGKLATLTTLCLLIFGEALISSLKTVLKINHASKDKIQLWLSVAVGFSSIILWLLLILLPLAQASRLTSKCRRLRRLGVQIRSRPFIYSDTPQLDLDSFLQYTNATRYTAKLAGVPIYPSLVFGGLFIIAMFGSFLIFSYPTFQFAPWF